jgi:hypothetical protein
MSVSWEPENVQRKNPRVIKLATHPCDRNLHAGPGVYLRGRALAKEGREQGREGREGRKKGREGRKKEREGWREEGRKKGRKGHEYTHRKT